MENKIKELLKKYNERKDYFQLEHDNAVRNGNIVNIEKFKQGFFQIIDFISDLEKLLYKVKK